MPGILTRLEVFCAKCRFGIVVLVLTAAMMLWLESQAGGLQNDLAPQGIVSLELAGSRAQAEAIVGSWQPPIPAPNLVPNARRQVYWDFIFIALYSFALFHFGSWARLRALDNQRPLLATAARLAAWAGLAAGLLDIGENIGLLTALGSGASDASAARTSFCATTKFALVAASLAASLTAALAKPETHAPPKFTWQGMILIARATVAALTVVGLGLLLPPQTRDMLAALSWHGRHGIWSGAAFQFSLLFLALSAWYWSRAVLSARFQVADNQAARLAAAATFGGTTTDPLEWVPRLLFLAGAGIGGIAAWRSAAYWHLAAIVAWAALFLYLLRCRVHRQPAAAGPPAALWLDPLPLGNDLRRLLCYAPYGPPLAVALLSAAALFFVVAVVGTFAPGLHFWSGLVERLGRAFPGPSAVLLFLGLALGPMTALTHAADSIRLGGSVAGVPWAMRPPVFIALLAVAVVVPSLIDLHAVRVASSAPMKVADRKNVEELFRQWAENCQRGQTTLRPVIVAVSGGASRAGLWAARVLAEVDAAASGKGGAVFAVSSVSGGSLGAAAFVATLRGQGEHACGLTPENRAGFANAVQNALSEDALGPVLVGSLFGDLPRALAGIPATVLRHALAAAKGQAYHDARGGDRAEALERAFEANWSRALPPSFPAWNAGQRKAAAFAGPFLSLAYNQPGTARGGPLWIANGTDAQNGERVLTVPFNYDAWPFLGALDALTLLGEDVPVSTAVHNTARFALLSPAGELSPAREDPAGGTADKTHAARPTQLIDVGYFENEGLLTAWELARYLQDNAARVGGGRPIEPILVEATADAEDIPEDRIIRCRSDDAIEPSAHGAPGISLGRSRPLQVVVPLLGLYAVRGGHSDWILREVRRQYCATEQRFFHFYLYRTEDDVPLNWVLSPATSCAIWQAMSAGIPENGKPQVRRKNPNTDESAALATLLGSPLPSGGSTAAPPPQNCPKLPTAN